MLIIICATAQSADAGTRYKDIVFPSAVSTKDIQYGSNLALDGSTKALLLDLYKPADDTVSKRPLVIGIHGGSLIAGNRSEMAAFCTDLAQRGYVAATIDYRLGIETPKGITTILEALLRGVQDAKAAVRFFRSNAAEYGIDTSHIYLLGSSAGSMIAVHYAYWNQDEIPPEVDQAAWGTSEGTSGNPGYSSAINGIVNYCGAIIDPRWIEAGDVPVANFHGLLDTVVPPDSGVSSDFEIPLFGGVAISRTATQLGIYNHGAFFPLTGHGGNTDSLRPFSANFFYSLITLSTDPPDSFSSLALSATSLNIFRFDHHTFLSTAMDVSGNRVVLPSSWVQYSCDGTIGSIQPTGIFTPADTPDSGYVYVQFNDITDSCFVRTYGIQSIVVRPQFAVTDTIRTLQLAVETYDPYDVSHALPMMMFTLTSTDTSVGTVNSMGVFTGKMSGTTNIIVTFETHSDTSVITVESAVGTVSLDLFDSITGWSFSDENIDSLTVSLEQVQKTAGTASFKIEYTATYDALQSAYMVYLNKDISVYGIPDAIALDVKSDGRRHRLYYRFSDVDSESYRASGKKYLNDSVNFSFVDASMSALSPLEGASGTTFPLTLNRLEIQIALDRVQGAKTSGTIYLDNLRLMYPSGVTGIETERLVPTVYRLEQNYPNPFNPSTTINYQIPEASSVTITIYNTLGQEVKRLIHKNQFAGFYSVQWNGTNHDNRAVSSGMYIYRIEAAGGKGSKFTQVKKMMLVK